MIEEFKYQLQVEQLAKKSNISVHKARNFIKCYRRLLKSSLKEGNRINIVGIASIWPSVRESVREVFDYTYGYEEQVKDLSEELEIDIHEVHTILKSYLRMLIINLQMGYSVKISGVLLIKPDLFDNDEFGYVTRLSPTLEKPERFTLKTKDYYGNLTDTVIEEEKIIFRLELEDTLENPKRLRLTEKNRIELNYVSDDLLG